MKLQAFEIILAEWNQFEHKKTEFKTREKDDESTPLLQSQASTSIAISIDESSVEKTILDELQEIHDHLKNNGIETNSGNLCKKLSEKLLDRFNKLFESKEAYVNIYAELKLIEKTRLVLLMYAPSEIKTPELSGHDLSDKAIGQVLVRLAGIQNGAKNIRSPVQKNRINTFLTTLTSYFINLDQFLNTIGKGNQVMKISGVIFHAENYNSPEEMKQHFLSDANEYIAYYDFAVSENRLDEFWDDHDEFCCIEGGLEGFLAKKRKTDFANAISPVFKKEKAQDPLKEAMLKKDFGSILGKHMKAEYELLSTDSNPLSEYFFIEKILELTDAYYPTDIKVEFLTDLAKYIKSAIDWEPDFFKVVDETELLFKGCPTELKKPLSSPIVEPFDYLEQKYPNFPQEETLKTIAAVKTLTHQLPYESHYSAQVKLKNDTPILHAIIKTRDVKLLEALYEAQDFSLDVINAVTHQNVLHFVCGIRLPIQDVIFIFTTLNKNKHALIFTQDHKKNNFLHIALENIDFSEKAFLTLFTTLKTKLTNEEFIALFNSINAEGFNVASLMAKRGFHTAFTESLSHYSECALGKPDKLVGNMSVFFYPNQEKKKSALWMAFVNKHYAMIPTILMHGGLALMTEEDRKDLTQTFMDPLSSGSERAWQGSIILGKIAQCEDKNYWETLIPKLVEKFPTEAVKNKKLTAFVLASFNTDTLMQQEQELSLNNADDASLEEALEVMSKRLVEYQIIQQNAFYLYQHSRLYKAQQFSQNARKAINTRVGNLIRHLIGLSNVGGIVAAIMIPLIIQKTMREDEIISYCIQFGGSERGSICNPTNSRYEECLIEYCCNFTAECIAEIDTFLKPLDEEYYMYANLVFGLGLTLFFVAPFCLYPLAYLFITYILSAPLALMEKIIESHFNELSQVKNNKLDLEQFIDGQITHLQEEGTLLTDLGTMRSDFTHVAMLLMSHQLWNGDFSKASDYPVIQMFNRVSTHLSPVDEKGKGNAPIFAQDAYDQSLQFT